MSHQKSIKKLKKRKKCWYRKRFNLGSEEEKALREISKAYGVPIHIRNKRSWCAGFSHGLPEGVYVFLRDQYDNTREDIQHILSTALHEIGHIEMDRRKKFKYYSQYQDDPEDMSTKALRAICRTGYRAELYCEKIGKEIMELYFPGLPFVAGYEPNDKDSRKWLNKNYLKQYSDELKRRRK